MKKNKNKNKKSKEGLSMVTDFGLANRAERAVTLQNYGGRMFAQQAYSQQSGPGQPVGNMTGHHDI